MQKAVCIDNLYAFHPVQYYCCEVRTGECLFGSHGGAKRRGSIPVPQPDFLNTGLRYACVYMSTKLPPEIKEKRALLGTERYYKLLVEKCAEFGASRDLVFLVHMASLRVIGQELNRHGVVRIPHVGTIALVSQKPRPEWHGRARVRLPTRKVLKMYPHYMLRRVYNAKKNFGVSLYRYTREEILPLMRDEIR